MKEEEIQTWPKHTLTRHTGDYRRNVIGELSSDVTRQRRWQEMDTCYTFPPFKSCFWDTVFLKRLCSNAALLNFWIERVLRGHKSIPELKSEAPLLYPLEDNVQPWYELLPWLRTPYLKKRRKVFFFFFKKELYHFDYIKGFHMMN